MTGASEVALSPDGWIAQRFPVALSGVQHWILTFLDDDRNLSVRLLDDDEVVDWPRRELPGRTGV